MNESEIRAAASERDIEDPGSEKSLMTESMMRSLTMASKAPLP